MLLVLPPWLVAGKKYIIWHFDSRCTENKILRHIESKYAPKCFLKLYPLVDNITT